MSGVRTHIVNITKSDAAKQIVYGVVYAPYTMDSQGEFMFPEHIEKMAHDFMRLDLKNSIDTNHDKKPNGCFPVESFVAKGHPDFPEGAWVLGTKLTDAMWARYEKGEINAYSFEAMTHPVEVEVEVETFRDHIGLTEKAADHDHLYFLHVNEMGRITKGWTDEVNGHTHTIKGGSKTGLASNGDGHSHRFHV